MDLQLEHAVLAVGGEPKAQRADGDEEERRRPHDRRVGDFGDELEPGGSPRSVGEFVGGPYGVLHDVEIRAHDHLERLEVQ